MQIDKNFYDQYDKLIRYVLTREFRVRPSNLEDLVSQVYERLLTTDTFDPRKSNFTTWLKWSVIRSVVSNDAKKKARSQDALDHAVDLDAAANVIGAEDAGDAKDELERVFQTAIDSGDLTARDIHIFKQFHLGGYTALELSRRYTLSSRSIEDVVYRTMKVLRENAAE